MPELVDDASHHLLQHQLQRHDAGDAPVLVDDHRHLLARVLHLPEQLADQLRLRDERRRAHQRRQRRLVADGVVRQRAQDVLDADYAHNVIDVVVVDRETRVRRRMERLVELGDARILLEPDDLGARDHDLPRPPVVEMKHTIQQLRFILADGAFLRADVDQHPQLGLGHRMPRLLGRENVGHDRQSPRHRLHQPREPFDGQRGRECDALGRARGDHLRRVLTELRRDQRHRDQADEVAPAAEFIDRDDSARSRREEHRDILDDHDHPEERLLVRLQPLDGPRAAAALFERRADADPVRRDDGDLDGVHRGIRDEATDEQRNGNRNRERQ